MHAFDVLGNPVRRRILELLAQGTLTSGAIVEAVQREFDISQPAVSQHLRVLRDSGFATVQVDGRRTTEIWSDGVAEYRWQLTADLGHFWHPGQARKMWDEMLSKYRRTAGGGLVRVD